MAEAHDQTVEGCRVLVAARGHAVLDDMAKAFRGHGLELVGPVSELSDAMSLMDDDGFDVAVIDLGLHADLVHSLAEQLQRQQIPFAFATDDDATASPDRFRAIARWRKPIELEAVLGGLATLCSRAANKIVPIDPKG